MSEIDEILSQLRKWKEQKGSGKGSSFTKETYNIVSNRGATYAARAIRENPLLLSRYTKINRTVAVVSDGSNVKGFGKLGHKAVLPLLEGKAAALSEFGGVDAVPIVLPYMEEYDFVSQIEMLSHSFGAVLLYGTEMARTSAVEQLYKIEAPVPVLHSEKDAETITILAALINAHLVNKKSMHTSRFAVLGMGIEGIGIAQLLLHHGVGDIVLVDRDGILSPLRSDMTPEKAFLAERTNRERRTGGVLEAVVGADVLVSTVSSYIPYEEYVRMMAQQPVVCITGCLPKDVSIEQLETVGASVVMQGEIGEQNCIHEDVVLPSLLRGVMEHNLKHVDNTLKIRIARALADAVVKPTQSKVIPTVFDKRSRSRVVHACS